MRRKAELFLDHPSWVKEENEKEEEFKENMEGELPKVENDLIRMMKESRAGSGV